MCRDRLDLIPPVLRSGRVVVRPWRIEDAPVLAAAWSDPEVIAGSDPPLDRSLAAATSWIRGVEARADQDVAVDMAIADPMTGRAMGEVGISQVERERRAALVGWWVGRPDRGRHVATDGVGLFVDWLLGPGRLNHVLAEIAAGNPASVRVALNTGFRLLRAVEGDRPAVFAIETCSR